MVTPAITATMAAMVTPAITAAMAITDTTIGLIMVITVAATMAMGMDIDMGIMADIIATDIMGRMG